MAIPKTQTSQFSRVEFVPSELDLVGGKLIGLFDDQIVTIGDAPQGKLPHSGRRLILKSTAIEVHDGQVWTQCSRCGHTNSLEKTGIRSMPSGDLRNQAQCSSCRSLKPAKKTKNLSDAVPTLRLEARNGPTLRNLEEATSTVSEPSHSVRLVGS